MQNHNSFLDTLHKLMTGIFIPIICFILSEIEHLRDDLKTFQVQVAKEASHYANREDIFRIEQKLDDMRTLFIQELKKGK